MAETMIYEIEANGQIFEIEGPPGASTADLAPVVEQYLAQQQQEEPAAPQPRSDVRTRQGAADVPTDIPTDLGQGFPGGPSTRGRVEGRDQVLPPPLQQTPPALEFATEVARSFNRGLEKDPFTGPITRRLFDQFGIAEDPGPAGSGLERVARRGVEAVGETVALGGLATVAAKRVAAGIAAGGRMLHQRGLVEGLLERFFKTAATAPGKVTSAEASAAFLGGATGESLDSEGNSPAARFFGEMVGSVTPAAAVGVGRGFVKYSPVAAGLRSLARLGRDPRRNPQIMDIAADRLQRASPTARFSLDGGAENLLPEARQRFSAAERAGDKPLLGIERYLLSRDPDLADQGTERLRDVQELIRASARTAATGEERVDPDFAREYLDGLVETSLEDARKQLMDNLEALPSGATRRELNLQARNLIEQAQRAARETEGQLWQAVPTNLRTTADEAASATKRLLDEAESSRIMKQDEDIQLPKEVTRFLGQYRGKGKSRRFVPGPFAKGTGASVKELQDMRSKLRRLAQEERGKAAPNQNYVRMLTDINDALLTDIGKVADADEALTIARQFSVDLNERFTRGVVGRALGFDRSGTEMVDPAMTLESLIGAGSSPARAERGRGLMEAVELKLRGEGTAGNPQEMRQVMSEFLLDEFRRQAIPNGEFSPRRARTYLTQRQDLLEMFPEVRQGVERAIQAGDAAAAGVRRYSPSQSAVGIVLGAPPGKEARRLFNSPEGATAARATMDMLADNPQATLGFQQGVIDELLRDVFSVDVIRGRALGRKMDDPNVRRVLDQVLTDEQRGRLRQLRATAERLDAVREARPRDAIVLEETMLGEFARRFSAAGAARAIGQRAGVGGTVQIPQAAVKLSERLLDAGLDPARTLIRKAVLEDDELLKELLSRRTSLSRDDKAWQLLNIYAQKAAVDYNIDISDGLREDAQEDERSGRERPVGVE